MRLVVCRGTAWFPVRADGRPDRTSQRPAHDRAITAADFIADGRACGATDTTANGGVQGGVVGVRLSSGQCNCADEIFDFHVAVPEWLKDCNSIVFFSCRISDPRHSMGVAF
jgi:hypothetical protein